jgi:N-glycosylase/DNA lyase
MKESSHFLRNIGYKNLAIIDFHVLDLLEEYQIITRPKTMTKKQYLEIEEILLNIANQLNVNLAELDLYLWYAETGKVYK